MLLPQLLILSQLLLLPQLLLVLKLLFLQQLLPQLLLPSFEIRDKLVGSEINKLLHSYSSKTRPRQSSANMLHVRCLRYLMTSSSIMTTPSSIMTNHPPSSRPPSVRPDPASPLEEASLKVSLQPFRLNIDQDTLFFIIDFANTLMPADPVPEVGDGESRRSPLPGQAAAKFSSGMQVQIILILFLVRFGIVLFILANQKS